MCVNIPADMNVCSSNLAIQKKKKNKSSSYIWKWPERKNRIICNGSSQLLNARIKGMTD